MLAKKIVRAAAVQLNPVLNNADGTIGKVLDAIADASTKGVNLIVFPETVVPYYPYFSFVESPSKKGADHTLN